VLFAFRIAPFKFTKAALGIHQSTTHLLELGDFLRNDLAGARVDLTTACGHLGHRPVHFGTNRAQFRHGLHHA
jgi:hypothetical protein